MMSSKKNRIISILLVLTLIFQFAGCSGNIKKLSGEPSEVLNDLQASIRKLNTNDILSLTTAEKGSSLYQEYESCLNIDAYDENLVKCYRAVAENVTFKYEDSDISIGNRIAKVHLTVVMPEWKKVFGDISFADADTVVEMVNKAEKEENHITLRIIETKDGLKIKNTEDLMELLEFVGWDIASAPSWNPDQPGESKPVETEPSETEPSETAPSETEPSETEPSTAKDPTKAPEPGSKEDKAAAYADYKKVLEKNKASIEWYEKNVSTNSCGLVDINRDGIPELFFFSKSASDDKFIAFNVYSYLLAKGETKQLLTANLTEHDSKVSEFFVIRDASGSIVSYRGFIDDKNVISYYSSYEFSNYNGTMAHSGYMMAGIVGGNKANAVCTIRGFGKYGSNGSITYDEFLKIEEDLLGKTDVLFGGKFLPSSRSTAAGLMKDRNPLGQDYNKVLKQLG